MIRRAVLWVDQRAGYRAGRLIQDTFPAFYFSGKQRIGRKDGCLKESICLTGEGIDYRHPAFRNADGTTRILALWDQSLSADAVRGFLPPEGFLTGVEFTEQQINAALSEGGQEGVGMQPEGTERFFLPERDISGHGTAVAGIAAGTDGVAPESKLLIVKLGMPKTEAFPRTTELMRAVTYLVRKAVAFKLPIAVNLSFGNTYGSHDGTSLLERFLDNASEVGRCVICVGSGNEGAAMGHAVGKVEGETERIELEVGAYESAFNVQLWKNYADIFRITLISPGGERIVFSTDEIGAERLRRMRLEETQLLLYIGEPTPYSSQQEIYLDFLPLQRYVNAGIWTFLLEPVRIVTGNYSMYLPSQTAVSMDTRFYRPTPETTLTIPSTAARVITVGAYDTTYDAYADFSGRGYLFAANAQERTGIALSKPDLVAPGVGIVTAAAGGGSLSVTGTSFAAPFVTGSAALLMQWGITMGNDRYLYGQKIKAYLQRGARALPGFSEFPNPQVGYGALCVADSLPI